tara:strand:+ start:2823 stop:4679 length:1857 start_codon:yes stop_codon:yes gene_type:complete
MDNLSLISLAGYEQPKAVEDKRKEWVAYGEDNDFYSHLITAYLGSTTNNAAIRSIADLVYGQGISIEGLEIDSNEVKELRKVIGHRCLKKIILERKMLGQAAMQVIYSKAGNDRKVVKVKHFPIHTLRPEKMDAEGVVNNYYYHPNWAEKKRSDVLKKIPAFGTSKEAVEIILLKPYVSGYSYFCPVDYSGALPYAELEGEISDYLLNDAKNGFSGTKVINFNNGVPSAEQRDMITRDVKGKLTGSKGQKVIVAFNEDAESKTTVEDISLDDAPSHYEYLAREASHKILVGHRVTSPMLLGIKEGGNGLASNADEIMVASQLFNSTVIRVYQDELLDTLEEILELNGEVPELMIVTSQPIEFTTEDQEGNKEAKETEEVSEKETEKENDKAEQNLSANFNPEDQVDWLTYLSKKGETIEELEGYDLVSAVIDEDETEEENWEQLVRDSIALELSSAPADNRSKASMQDTDFIKVRYAYVQGSKKSGNSNRGKKQRHFCTAMEAASRFYRKEDILQMQTDGVNSELGHNKAPYSLWRHKGGVNCHHKWERRIYVKREKADGTPWGGSAMNGVKKATAKEARAKGFNKEKGKFRNEKRVAEAQIDRADKGHHPSYKGKKK